MEEYMEYLDEMEDNLHKGLKLVQKAKQKIGQMGFRDGGYGNRFNGMMPNGYPPMGFQGQMGMPGQMGFREQGMMERNDYMGRNTRG